MKFTTNPTMKTCEPLRLFSLAIDFSICSPPKKSFSGEVFVMMNLASNPMITSVIPEAGWLESIFFKTLY